jgi:hypothetical protein
LRKLVAAERSCQHVGQVEHAYAIQKFHVAVIISPSAGMP